jgi:hypothetical protein
MCINEVNNCRIIFNNRYENFCVKYGSSTTNPKTKTMARYSKKAGEKVEEAMHEKKRGQLKSGRSGKKVTSRKQAIAIGLSEARKEGAKVPKKGAAKKGGAKKGAKKGGAKKGTGKGGAKKGARKTSRKSGGRKRS